MSHRSTRAYERQAVKTAAVCSFEEVFEEVPGTVQGVIPQKTRYLTPHNLNDPL